MTNQDESADRLNRIPPSIQTEATEAALKSMSLPAIRKRHEVGIEYRPGEAHDDRGILLLLVDEMIGVAESLVTRIEQLKTANDRLRGILDWGPCIEGEHHLRCACGKLSTFTRKGETV